MIRMSFSSKSTYDTCPAWFEFKYIKKSYAFQDPKNTMLGNVIGTYFEWFHTYRLYDVDWQGRMKRDVDSSIMKNTEKINIDDYRDFLDSIRETCYDLIPKGVDNIKKNGLMAPFAQAEADLAFTYEHPSRAFPIQFLGRADFVYYHSKTDVRIFDGKASKYRHKNVHEEQLKLYATLFYLKYHVAPTQLGFIYWYFPKKPIDLVYFDADDLVGMINSCYKTAEKILDREFRAKPAGHCHICPYLGQCNSGQEYRKSNKKVLPIISNEFFLEEV